MNQKVQRSSEAYLSRVQSAGCRVQGAGCRVQGAGGGGGGEVALPGTTKREEVAYH
jgi:hypothetical protein